MNDHAPDNRLDQLTSATEVAVRAAAAVLPVIAFTAATDPATGAPRMVTASAAPGHGVSDALGRMLPTSFEGGPRTLEELLICTRDACADFPGWNWVQHHNVRMVGVVPVTVDGEIEAALCVATPEAMAPGPALGLLSGLATLVGRQVGAERRANDRVPVIVTG